MCYYDVKTFAVVLLFSGLLFACKAKDRNLREGDLLFKQVATDDFSKAVAAATNAVDSFNFTHVGVVHWQHDSCYVIEAIEDGVCMTPIVTFMQRDALVVQARLKPAYSSVIPQAMRDIQAQIGKPYDNYFDAYNDAYYCSELIQQFFCYQGASIFPAIAMNFKDKTTGEYPAYWKEHFQRLSVPIPQGAEGSNPGDISKSDKLIILGELLY